MQGKNIPQKYSVMLRDGVQQDATYCCVKSFVRDTSLQQPPVLLSPAGRASAIATRLPTQLIAKREMTEDEIKNFLKLASLCSAKYGMPLAAEALKNMVFSRDYESVQFCWLLQPHLATYGVTHSFPKGDNVHFPHLPDSTWQMCARVS